MSGRYDYVVVGGGSAGCVAAAELARDPDVQVLLLERGDAADDNPETLRADGYKEAFVNDRLVWERFSEPQDACGGRPMFMGSGNGLGGSGAINAMVYTRGAAADYEQWPDGWRWNDVVPDFEAVERQLDPHRRPPTEWTEACIAASEAAGFRRKEDLNDGDLHGVLGYEWMNYAGEQRRSSYVAFVRSQPRPNLHIETGALAHRIVVDADGRATAVEYERDGVRLRAEATREIVLCSGALETPKLLLLSGIGPGQELRSHGIPTAAEVPEIGSNLHDHPNVQVFFRGKREVDCVHPQLYGFHRVGDDGGLPSDAADTCYVFYPARSSFREGLIRLLPGIALPQSLYRGTPLPSVMRSGIAGAFGLDPVRRFIARMWGIVVILGKPASRGVVGLASRDPRDDAKLDPRYLSEPQDMRTMLRGVRLARDIAAQGPLAQWGNAELLPGPMGRSERALEKFIRDNAMTTYHYAGTCRMGEDEAAPVDTRLRLRGVRGLRVADASAIPFTPVAALNAPSMLVGYRAARFIREEA